MDRFSLLPLELIRLMVPHLPANLVACILKLSKRYRHLCTIRSKCKFDEAEFLEGNFTDFVTDELYGLESTVCITKLTLKSDIDTFDINCWLRNVSNRNIMNIKLCVLELPRDIFICKTLVKLRIGRDFTLTVTEIPKKAKLPLLDSLTFDLVLFHDIDGCPLQTILVACPKLRELVINEVQWEHWVWSEFISSPSLQRLTIRRALLRFDAHEEQTISFVLPNLVYLEYNDFVPDQYPSVTFDSLNEAKLYLILMEDRHWDGQFAHNKALLSSNPTNFLCANCPSQ